MLLTGNALAAFMDFGIGTAVATGIAYWYEVSLPWYLVFLGGILSLIPDFDLVPSVIRGVSPKFDHRQTPFHRPLLILPLAIITAYLFGGSMWALITGICVFGHYIHDTNFVGTDYGIAWFWPFSHRYWSVFGSFAPAKLDQGSHHVWLRQNWLQPSILSLREIGIGLVGIYTALWFMYIPAEIINAVVLSAIVLVNCFWISVRLFPL
jgi:LexA-binding, inner membrane-associated putative hydrolase